MRVEDMAVATVEMAVAMEDTVADMPRPATLGADMLAMSKLDTLFAADVPTIMRAMRAETRAMQGAILPGLAVVNGEETVIGEVIMDIRTLDIPSSAITAPRTAIRTTGMAITDIVPGGTILTDTDTRPT
jgi:hypothetical protein